MHEAILTFFFSVLLVTFLSATTITWEGGVDDEWGNPLNWQENTLPIMTDTVIISGSLSGAPSPVVTFFDSPGNEILALHLLDGATLNVKSGTLHLVNDADVLGTRIIIQNSELTNTGIINIASGENGIFVDFPNGGDSEIENAGQIIIRDLSNIAIFLLNEMTNSGSIKIDSCGRGLLLSTDATFDNLDSLSISNSDILAISNTGVMVNAGRVLVHRTGVAISSSNSLTNEINSEIAIDCAKTGIRNSIEGTILNKGVIKIDSSAVGIDNENGYFHNYRFSSSIEIRNITPQAGRTDYFGILNEGQFTNGRSSDIFILNSQDSVTGIYNKIEDYDFQQFFKNEGDIYVSHIEGVALNNETVFENFSFLNINNIEGVGIVNKATFSLSYNAQLDLPNVVFIDHTSMDAMQHMAGSFTIQDDTKFQTGPDIGGSHMDTRMGASITILGKILLSEGLGAL